MRSIWGVGVSGQWQLGGFDLQLDLTTLRRDGRGKRDKDDKNSDYYRT